MKLKAFLTYLSLFVICLLLITFDLTNRITALKSFIRYILFPAPEFALRVISGAKAMGGNLSALVMVFEQNRQLKKKIEELKYYESQYVILSDENDILRRMLDITKKSHLPMVASVIISRGPSNWFNTVVIDKGTSSKIKVDMPVAALSGEASGLVGRTIDTGSNYSKVMLITDPLSYIPVKVLRNGETGIVSGGGGGDMKLEYLVPGSDVRLGDKVITSGVGEIFPEGILVGTVSGRVSQGKTYFFQTQVTPEVNLGKIEKVMVLLK